MYRATQLEVSDPEGELLPGFLLPRLLCVAQRRWGPGMRTSEGKAVPLANSSRIWNRVSLGLIPFYLPLYSHVSLGKLVNLSKLGGLSSVNPSENGDEG